MALPLCAQHCVLSFSTRRAWINCQDFKSASMIYSFQVSFFQIELSFGGSNFGAMTLVRSSVQGWVRCYSRYPPAFLPSHGVQEYHTGWLLSVWNTATCEGWTKASKWTRLWDQTKLVGRRIATPNVEALFTSSPNIVKMFVFLSDIPWEQHSRAQYPRVPIKLRRCLSLPPCRNEEYLSTHSSSLLLVALAWTKYAQQYSGKVRRDRSSMNLALEMKDNIMGCSCYLLPASISVQQNNLIHTQSHPFNSSDETLVNCQMKSETSREGTDQSVSFEVIFHFFLLLSFLDRDLLIHYAQLLITLKAMVGIH